MMHPVDLQRFYFPGFPKPGQSRRGFCGISSSRSFPAFMGRLARRCDGSGAILRGSSEVERQIHNLEAVGSSPSPATIRAACCRASSARGLNLSRVGRLLFTRSRRSGCEQNEEAKGNAGESPADRAIFRRASFLECLFFLILGLLGAVVAAALLFALCWFFGGVQ